MRTFPCEICRDHFPIGLKNDHHRIPKSLGGPDTLENIAFLCAGCHQNLHSIAYMIVNQKRHHEVEPSVSSIFPNDPQAQKKILELARQVARELALRKEIRKNPTDEVRTVVELPQAYMELIRLAGYDLPSPHGKPAGVARMIRFWVADQLIKKFPLRKAQIEALKKPK